MMLRLAVVAALAATALPALAGEVRLLRPVETGNLAAGAVSLSAFYVPLPDEAYEVTATWLAAGEGEPSRLTVQLDEGDVISFSLPGHPETRFTLARDPDGVTVTARPVVRADEGARSL